VFQVPFLVASNLISLQNSHMDNMNAPQQRSPETAEEIISAIFTQCLMTLTQSADYLLGKVKAPDTGEPVIDLPRVQLIIKQLEILDNNAAKLSIEEQQFVKQSLQELRMAYVSTAGKRPEDDDKLADEAPSENSNSTEIVNDPELVQKNDDPQESEAEEETNQKRFVKKYD